MTKGWYKESRRHALASKGITTSEIRTIVEQAKSGQVNEQNPQNEPNPQNLQYYNSQNSQNKQNALNKQKQNEINKMNKQNIRNTNEQKSFTGMETYNDISDSWLGKKLGLNLVNPNVVEDVEFKWDLEGTGVPQFDASLVNYSDPNRDYDVVLEDVPINHLIRQQYYIISKVTGTKHPAYDFWTNVSETKEKELLTLLSHGERIRPFLVLYDEQGRLMPNTVDPTTLLVAKELDIENVKIWKIKKRSDRDKLGEVYGKGTKEYREKLREIRNIREGEEVKKQKETKEIYQDEDKWI